MPFLNPLNFCFPSYWKNKLRLVGCWPFNGQIGKGYISKALVISGYQAGLPFPLSDAVLAGPGAPGPPSFLGPCGCCTKHEPYPDKAFKLHISRREYVTKAARRASLIGNFCCEVARGGNHLQNFLLWMLYKGAYQNEDAPDSILTPGQKVSQYVPKVYGPAPCHA